MTDPIYRIEPVPEYYDAVAVWRGDLRIGDIKREFAEAAVKALNERAELVAALRDSISIRMNAHLVEMEEGYDDSIVGFNEAWDVVRKALDDSVSR
jgi:hypothetical protein